MVEQSLKEAGSPFRYHGDYRSGKELCEVLSSSYEFVLFRPGFVSFFLLRKRA